MARRSARRAAGLGPPQRTPPSAPRGNQQSRGLRAWGFGTALLAAAAVAGTIVIVVGRNGHVSSSAQAIDWSRVPHLQTRPAPWSSGSRYLSDRLAASGLHGMSMDNAVLHHHEHLDIYVHGKHVRVPALVGIDPVGGFLTELHTHDATGILHVESPTQQSFKLGQFFCEWGVKLTANCIGRYRGRVSWWVNGKPMHGDPSTLTLTQHQEIVLAVDGVPAHIPTSYRFPAGL